MEKTGVVFAGAGVVADLHARAVAAIPDAELLGIFDPQPAKARKLTRLYGGRVFGSLEEMLAEPRASAVHVLTPTAQHVDTAIAALAAGKHVLVEKPVAREVSQIRRLQRAAERAKRVCMPAHNYIYTPALERAKRLITEGRLGNVGSLWVIYNIFHSEEIAKNYAGPLREVCVHHAYSTLYLLGRPLRLTASVSSVHYAALRQEDQVMIVAEMPSGAIANLWCSFSSNDRTSDPWTVLYKVIGTKGSLSYTWNEAQIDDTRGPGWDLPCYEDGFRREIEHFVRGCIGRGEAPLSTLADAADALTIVNAAEQAAKRKASVELKWGRVPK